MVGTTVGATGIVHGVGTGIDGNMGQGPAGVGEHNQVTGDKVCVCGIRIRVPGHTAACFAGKIAQSGFPAPHAGGGVGSTVHCCCFHRIVNPCRVNTFDIGKVVAHVIGNKRGTHQTIGFKGCDVGSPPGDGTGIRYGFIAVQERRVIIVTDVRQHFRGVGVDIGGSVLCHIQPSVVFHLLDIVTGVFQSPEDTVVIHLIRNQTHIRHECDPIGIDFQKIVGEIIIHGQAIGIGPFRVIRVLRDNGIRPDNEAGFFLALRVRGIVGFRRLCGLCGICHIHICLRLRFLLGFGGDGCFLRSFCRSCCFLSCFDRSRCFLRFYRFSWIRCIGGNRFRCIRRLGCCGFAAANVCCRHCLRGKTQDQNDGQQERKQPFADWFQVQFHPSWEQNKPPLFERRLSGSIQL